MRLLALEETTGLLGRHAGDAKCLLALEESGLCVLACPGGEMHQIPPARARESHLGWVTQNDSKNSQRTPIRLAD